MIKPSHQPSFLSRKEVYNRSTALTPSCPGGNQTRCISAFYHLMAVWSDLSSLNHSCGYQHLTFWVFINVSCDNYHQNQDIYILESSLSIYHHPPIIETRSRGEIFKISSLTICIVSPGGFCGIFKYMGLHPRTIQSGSFVVEPPGNCILKFPSVIFTHTKSRPPALKWAAEWYTLVKKNRQYVIHVHHSSQHRIYSEYIYSEPSPL